MIKIICALRLLKASKQFVCLIYLRARRRCETPIVRLLKQQKT